MKVDTGWAVSPFISPPSVESNTPSDRNQGAPSRRRLKRTAILESAAPCRHPERSRGIPTEVTFKIAQRGPSTGARDDYNSRSVVDAFSFSLLMNRLRHFLVESIALPCFRQPLVFGLDISLALFRNLLDLFLQTISLCARFADASFHLLFR